MGEFRYVLLRSLVEECTLQMNDELQQGSGVDMSCAEDSPGGERGPRGSRSRSRTPPAMPSGPVATISGPGANDTRLCDPVYHWDV